MLFEVLFYVGDYDPPAYFLVGEAEGETPEEALRANLPQLITTVREMFDLEEDIPDWKIGETLNLLHPNGLVPARNFWDALP